MKTSFAIKLCKHLVNKYFYCSCHSNIRNIIILKMSGSFSSRPTPNLNSKSNDIQPISEKELLHVIKDILKRNGYLNKLAAEMRAQVTDLLRERQQNPDFVGSEPPRPTGEVLLVNEMVKEYLEWNGYLYTAAVMTSEAGMPTAKKTRSELCAEVGVKDDEKSSALPLLSNIVAAYTERIRRKINKSRKDIT